MLSALVGTLRDFDVAEDVLQDAVVAALTHWPERGIPRHPDAWLLQTARRRAIDIFRRKTRFRDRQGELARLIESQPNEDEEPQESIVDERLSMIFTCCHPALAEQARVALTLRTLGGLTTTEISRAFLVPETTMAQRLVRAKGKIRAANIPYRVPPPELWPERLESVLAVVYFIFNEGYGASSGNRPTREDLCDEAIRLGRLLVELAPQEPETGGLLALMLLHDSRREARVDDEGRFVALQDQDRSLWDRAKIEAGDKLLRAALAKRRPGPYQLQAAISAVHAGSPSHDETDWHEITLLYRRLHDLQPSWVIKLNEIVALSYADGAESALEALTELDHLEKLQRYQPYWAARADLLRRAGRIDEAGDAYRRAIDLSLNDSEREFLERRRRSLPS